MFKRLAKIIYFLILAERVAMRVEAMKAANAAASAVGEQPCYGAEAFNYEAEYLDNIAAKLNKLV